MPRHGRKRKTPNLILKFSRVLCSIKKIVVTIPTSDGRRTDLLFRPPLRCSSDGIVRLKVPRIQLNHRRWQVLLFGGGRFDVRLQKVNLVINGGTFVVNVKRESSLLTSTELEYTRTYIPRFSFCLPRRRIPLLLFRKAFSTSEGLGYAPRAAAEKAPLTLKRYLLMARSALRDEDFEILREMAEHDDDCVKEINNIQSILTNSLPTNT